MMKLARKLGIKPEMKALIHYRGKLLVVEVDRIRIRE